MLVKFAVFCALCTLVYSQKVRYDNYTLYKVQPQNEDHLQFLEDLHQEYQGLDFWRVPHKTGEYASVVTPPELRSEFEHNLSKRSIYSEVMLENLQEAFEAQAYSRRKRDTSRQLYWTGYQSLDEIYEWFEYLAENYRDVVTLVHAGESHEGRNITGVRIARRSGRRAIFLEGGQVGADWLSPVVLTYVVDQLVRGENPEARAASEEFEWHIFPILNPDGHVFSDNSVRLWMKNRRPISNTAVGVDLTKNWNSHWGVRGASFTPADDNYVGLGPFSEPETRSVSRYIESIGHDLAALLSFRAYGQRLLVPFAHTTEQLYNYQEMITIGRRAMGSLAVQYNTQYLVDTSPAVHDGATGSIADWAKYRFYPPIVATFQLRDEGTWGYALPAVQVLPSCEETFDALMAILREAKYIDQL